MNGRISSQGSSVVLTAMEHRVLLEIYYLQQEYHYHVVTQEDLYVGIRAITFEEIPAHLTRLHEKGWVEIGKDGDLFEVTTIPCTSNLCESEQAVLHAIVRFQRAFREKPVTTSNIVDNGCCDIQEEIIPQTLLALGEKGLIYQSEQGIVLYAFPGLNPRENLENSSALF